MTRYAPQTPLPPYSYVTGQYPHPVRDPDGHRYGVEESVPPRPDPDRWPDSDAYLQGIDLFNHGYYWEAHEAWESLWHACERHGLIADFLKALIKLAAAGVKARERRGAGIQRHARRAAELFEKCALHQNDGQDQLMGLSVPELIRQSKNLADHPPQLPDTPAAPVETLLSMQLLPKK